MAHFDVSDHSKSGHGREDNVRVVEKRTDYENTCWSRCQASAQHWPWLSHEISRYSAMKAWPVCCWAGWERSNPARRPGQRLPSEAKSSKTCSFEEATWPARGRRHI